MRRVKHGKSHNIGLLIHYIIQSQEREVLEKKRSGEGVCRERQKIQVSDNVDSVSNLSSEEKYFAKKSVIKKKRG